MRHTHFNIQSYIIPALRMDRVIMEYTPHHRNIYSFNINGGKDFKRTIIIRACVRLTSLLHNKLITIMIRIIQEMRKKSIICHLH